MADHLNPTDATLWEIKRDPELRTTIVALVVLDRQPDSRALAAAIGRAIERFPRLRQRVEDNPLGIGRPRWVGTSPDLGYHLRHLRAPEPNDLRRALDICGVAASEEFDPARPLWQITVVDDLSEDRAALIVKLSHTLTDGVGGMTFLRAIADDADLSPADLSPADATDRPRSRTDWSTALAAATAVPTSVMSATLHPLHAAKSTLALAGSTVRFVSPAGPPLSPLMTGRGLGRWAGTVELPLERLRRAAHRADGTINDAFVTIAVTALADYHAQMGSDGRRFRLTIPVSFRRETDAVGGNQWTPARLVLEAEPGAHPFAELDRHRAHLRASTHDPAVSFGRTIAAGVQELPGSWTTGIVAGMVKGCDVALTDVPGIEEPLHIAGARVTSFFPFAPTGGAALNIGLVSHGEKACIGFTVDTSAVEDPERLLECFEDHAYDFLRRRRAPISSPDRVKGNVLRSVAGAGRTGAPSERLSALDTSFLRMEAPTTPMHMGGLFIIDGATLRQTDGRVDIGMLRAHIRDRLSMVPRLRKMVMEVPLELARPVWVDDPNFDIARHVHRLTLPEPGTRTQLFKMCEDLQMAALDRSHPLFDLTFIDGLDASVFGPGSLAVVERVHHALLDGMSGVEMVTVLFDASPDDWKVEGPARTSSASRPTASPGPFRLVADAVGERMREPWRLAESAVHALGKPTEVASNLGHVVGAVGDLVGSGLRAERPLPRSSTDRRRLRSMTRSLDSVHETGRQLGGTVNDVVLTAIAAGIGQLLRHQGKPLDELFTALVPVSTRRVGMESEAGNQVAALVVDLPIGDADPVSAFNTVSERTRRLKEKHHADGTEILLDAGDHLPPQFIDAVARLVVHQRSVDIVVTNMPGPPVPLYLRGCRVKEMIPIVPLGANLTLGVAIVSYNGELVLAFHADGGGGGELDVVVSAAKAAFERLASAAQQSPAR